MKHELTINIYETFMVNSCDAVGKEKTKKQSTFKNATPFSPKKNEIS